MDTEPSALLADEATRVDDPETVAHLDDPDPEASAGTGDHDPEGLADEGADPDDATLIPEGLDAER